MVVFYHLKFLEYGYLGVDMFLVINGYLITKSIIRNFYEKKQFSYVQFIFKRIIRLLPLVLIAGFISLIIGFFVMLPDDFENLGESIVASNLFSNNILASITTKNYWDTSQDYKPLMHTWYLGILVFFYLLYPFVFFFAKKISILVKKNFRIIVIVVISVLTIGSFILYLIETNDYIRFYYLPYRLFELLIGGLIALDVFKISYIQKKKLFSWIAFIVLLAFQIVGSQFISINFNSIRLLIVVLMTAFLIESKPGIRIENNFLFKIMSRIGMASYSIFIWHQIIIAYSRYIFTSSSSISMIILCLCITCVVSFLSFILFEKRFSSIKLKKIVIICILLFSITSSSGLVLYFNAGVVRDVPELDIYSNNIRRGMHAEYCDRVYSMDVEFNDEDTIKVLVVGDSFGRDLVNIFLESTIKDELDISYIYLQDLEDYPEKYVQRIEQAKYIFIRKLREDVPSIVIDHLQEDSKLLGIGTKKYGDNNGNIYVQRFSDDYFSLTASYKSVEDEYKKEKISWGNNYIDFIAPVLNDNGNVRVFTDENKYISQDCRHLTKSGAKFYAKIFDLKSLFDLN